MSPEAIRRSAAAATAALFLPAGGCGAERGSAPDARPQPAEATQRLELPAVGMSLSVPKTADTELRPRPGVFRATTGDWMLAAFAYRRREQLPRGRDELEAARRRLVREARLRGRRFEPIRSRLTRVARAPAIELVADQTISRNRLRTRSVHVYEGRAEYVLELLAPIDEFRRANRALLAPALRSLRVTGRVASRRPREGARR